MLQIGGEWLPDPPGYAYGRPIHVILLRRLLRTSLDQKGFVSYNLR